MKRIRKGSLNESIISALEKTAEGLVSFEDFVYHPYKYMGGHDIAPQRRPALLKSIQRLRMKGLVDKEIIEGKVILKLTSVGNDYLGIEREWDGKYRIVIWDIPENKRKIRDLFRRRLKEWKFINWQRSVWVSKKNVTGKLRKLVSDLGIEKWIAIVESEDASLEDIIFHDRIK